MCTAHSRSILTRSRVHTTHTGGSGLVWSVGGTRRASWIEREAAAARQLQPPFLFLFTTPQQQQPQPHSTQQQPCRPHRPAASRRCVWCDCAVKRFERPSLSLWSSLSLSGPAVMAPIHNPHNIPDLHPARTTTPSTKWHDRSLSVSPPPPPLTNHRHTTFCIIHA